MSRQHLPYVTNVAMIDLHQGFSGRELEEVPATLTSLAVVELDVASACLRGDLRGAARMQWAAARICAQALVRGARARLGGK